MKSKAIRKTKAWQPIAIVSGGIILVFVLLNYAYVWQQARYLFFPHPATTSSPFIQTSSTADTTSSTIRAEPDVVEIPSLGIRAPLKYVQEKSEAVFQRALQDGVVHYPGTAKPGEFGNAYIFGHSSDYAWSKGSYKTVFALLPKIKTGAEIIVTDPEGRFFTYTVVTTTVVQPDDLSVLDQGGHKRRMLTLQTSYPLGTALRRFLVIAELKKEN